MIDSRWAWITVHAGWLAALAIALATNDPVDPSLCGTAGDPFTNGKHGPFALGDHSMAANATAGLLLVSAMAAAALATIAVRVRRQHKATVRVTVVQSGVWMMGSALAVYAYVSQVDRPILCTTPSKGLCLIAAAVLLVCAAAALSRRSNGSGDQRMISG